jgi:hypothetical protein
VLEGSDGDDMLIGGPGHDVARGHAGIAATPKSDTSANNRCVPVSRLTMAKFTVHPAQFRRLTVASLRRDSGYIFRRLAAFGACSGRRFWASASHPSALSTAASCPDPGTWLASFRPARLQRCDEHVDTAAPCRVWRSAPRLHPAARTIYSSWADVSAGESGGSPWPQVSYSSSSFRSFTANAAGSLSGDHSLAAKPP